MTIQLRDYQQEAVNAVHAALRRSRKVICCMPTGSGKRLVGVWWSRLGAEHGRKILVATDRRILIEQMAEECKKHAVKYGIVMADSPRNDEALVQIASIQTLQHRKWKDMPEANLLLIDECFPAGTFVDGRPIETIREGDSVRSYNHATGKIESRKVIRVMQRDVDQLVTMWFNDARQITCTIEHPVFDLNENEYRPAKDMSPGTEVLTDGLQDVSLHMHDLRSEDRAKASGENAGSNRMLYSMPVEGYIADGIGDESQVCVGKNEIQQSNAQAGSSCKTVSCAACDQLEAADSEGQWTWADATRTDAGRFPGMESSCCAVQARTTKGRSSNELQNRPWQSHAEDRSRDRWQQPQIIVSEGTGQKETGVLRVVRLDRYQVYERAGGAGCTGVRRTCRVYNLEVEGNNNYFANGVLVHNCHQRPDAYKNLFARHPNAKVIGLTATPVGPQGKSLISSGMYDEIVEPIKNTQLINNNWLLKTHMFAPSEPDIQGVSLSNGKEYNQEELGDAVEGCTVFSDIFDWWRPYSDLQTIVFVPRVKYAYGIASQFADRGFESRVIEGGTTPKERELAFDAFRNRNVRVLVSCDVLREGLDLPVAQVGVDLQPNSQFHTWWQKLGRVRRPSDGQERAIWLDFAGNAWKHVLHPDEDPPWDELTDNLTTQDIIKKKAGRICPDCGGDNIYKGRCQDCGRVIVKQKEPWQCGSCKYSLSPWERLKDGKCPNCGMKIGKQTRRIRMKDGTMRVVSAEELGARKKEKPTKEQRVWADALHKAHYSGKKLSFARWLYKREMGTEPIAGLKDCPQDLLSGDWGRLPKDVYPWIGTKGKRS